MYEIISKKQLNTNTFLYRFYYPLIAEKAEPGQFVILRVDEKGERIPLTISDYDRTEGWFSVIFQVLGVSTKKLSLSDSVRDMAGPLGNPSKLDGFKEGTSSPLQTAVVGGGLGAAIAYPQAKKLHELGAEVDIIAGFRNKDLIILEHDMRNVSGNLYITTDDGSYGEKGFVTDKLKNLILSGKNYDHVIAVGPPVMMKYISLLTKAYNIRTTVSLNPIMTDGTGMCGGCRVTIGGEVKFACVDGPEFDGHLVDFDELIYRLKSYDKHNCKLEGL